jgi:hypothetical protein
MHCIKKALVVTGTTALLGAMGLAAPAMASASETPTVSQSATMYSASQTQDKHGDKKDGEYKHGDKKDGDYKHGDKKDDKYKHGDKKDDKYKHGDKNHGDKKDGDKKDDKYKHGDKNPV